MPENSEVINFKAYGAFEYIALCATSIAIFGQTIEAVFFNSDINKTVGAFIILVLYFIVMIVIWHNYIQTPNITLIANGKFVSVNTSRLWRSSHCDYEWTAVGEPYIEKEDGDSESPDRYHLLVYFGLERMCLSSDKSKSYIEKEANRFREFVARFRGRGHA